MAQAGLAQVLALIVGSHITELGPSRLIGPRGNFGDGMVRTHLVREADDGEQNFGSEMEIGTNDIGSGRSPT